MKKVLPMSLGVLLLIFMSVSAQAYIYNQPPLSTSSGGLVSSPAWSIYTPEHQVFDDFTLTSAYYITGITWWGFYNNSSPDPAFTIRMYDSASPTGAYTDISGSLTVENHTVGSTVIDEYSITLSAPFNAAANTTYWLSIYNAASNSSWSWQKADSLGNGAYQTNKGAVGNVAFQLEGSPVPIPPAAWLLASGLIALVVVRRRMRTR